MGQNKICAYHGTSARAAARIRRERFFWESRQDNEWLGTGAYFFTARKDAEDWTVKMKHRLKDGTVLTVQLAYEDREMLDLDDSAQLSAFNCELEKLEQRIGKNGTTNFDGSNGRERQWCFACNLYRKLHPEICITSYTFHRGLSGISQFGRNERQLCVSQQRIITEIL